MSESWITETIYGDYHQRFLATTELYREKTAFQELIIFESPRFGRVLVLDGAIQTTEADEFFYHEMLAHVPIMARERVKKILIIGGGDGGCLREVLKHGIDKATMVEIDRTVVDLCQEFMPGIAQGAFADPRAELVIADGTAFVRETDQLYDVIIVDSTDPVGPSLVLFEEDFYADCAARLTPEGILVTQSGVPFLQDREARTTHARLSRLFADARLYFTPVPTYVGGVMALGWGCASDGPRRTPLETIERRFAESRIVTRYYSPEIHRAAFALPPYIREKLG